MGQGHYWNDVKVFEANGFQVEKSGRYELLFKMLLGGRFDFFSRGMVEAFVEYEERRHTNIKEKKELKCSLGFQIFQKSEPS